MTSGNPALSADMFRGLPRVGGEAMSIQGTVAKTLMLLLLVVAAAGFTWSQAGTGLAGLLMIGGVLGGLVVALVTVFKKEWAPVTAPLYAVLQGLAIGGISAAAETRFPGVVMPAVGLTFGTMFAMLLAYQSGLIKVTEQFRLGMAAAIGGIMVFYLVQFGLGMFGIHIPAVNDGGVIGIGFSLVVVAVAALSLVLDFDMVEHGARSGAPKFMEWYGAFGLMVTLIWLYLEILNLLSKLQSNRE